MEEDDAMRRQEATPSRCGSRQATARRRAGTRSRGSHSSNRHPVNHQMPASSWRLPLAQNKSKI